MPEFVSLDESGHLVAEGNAGRRWLSSKRGRWRIVPASEDFVLLRREQADARGQGVRAILSGDLEGMALGELLAFLAQSRWTGVLTVASGAIEKSVFLKQGAVRWAVSNLPADRLGEVVRRLGLVTEEGLQRIAAEEGNAGVRFGQLLLSTGVLDAAGLYKALRHQVEEIFFSVLLLDHGVMFLFNDPVEGRFPAQISLDLNGLLMDALRRIDEFGHFKKRIPGPEAYPVRKGREPSGLNEVEQNVWELVDGKRTVGEIATEAHLAEFDATKILFGLAEAGYIEVSARKPELVLGAGLDNLQPEVREIARVFNTIFREVHDEIARIAPTTGFRLGVESFLTSDQHPFQELFGDVGINDEGMLSEEKLLTNLAALGPEKAPDPARYLYEALNDLMFFELFQAGEILTYDRDEDLSRRVKAIYEMLGH